MRIDALLFSQGFGTRRECEALAQSGRVRAGGRTADDLTEAWDPEGLVLEVDGVEWPVRRHAVVMLNKPQGYECSQRGSRWPSVLNLLPPPLRRRGVQPVGRLDQDTTGLLVMTDDGTLLHRMTSPRHHVIKVYEVQVRHALDDTQEAALRAGVVLHDDPHPVAATATQRVGDHCLRLTLTQGKYHQVKRMLAAVGNRVEALHRVQVGGLALPSDLAPGAWRWIDPADVLRPA